MQISLGFRDTREEALTRLLSLVIGRTIEGQRLASSLASIVPLAGLLIRLKM